MYQFTSHTFIVDFSSPFNHHSYLQTLNKTVVYHTTNNRGLSFRRTTVQI